MKKDILQPCSTLQYVGSKVIYFVRHGETELNAKGIRQGPDGPLSEFGRRQVAQTAKKFPHSKGKPKIILSSPFQRARETAEILARELELKIEYSELLRERKNPTQIIGHSGKEEIVRFIVDTIDKTFHQDDLRYSDEENFTDLRNRARDLLHFLEKRRENQIIAVTHGIFLKMVVAYMLYGERLTASDYNKLSFFNPMDNAALTICTCRTRFLKKPKWELLVWNNTPIPTDQ